MPLLWMTLLPFLGSIALGTRYIIAPQKKNMLYPVLSCLVLLVSFVLAIGMAFSVLGSEEVIVFDIGSWMSAGTYNFRARLYLDSLSSILTLLVTGIGFLVHLYSLGYMHEDPKVIKYFSYLNLFCGFMLVLITASSLPLLFVGWEGVGLCSFLLIGFWYQDQEKSFAGRKAFIVNRIGDAAFILAMALALHAFGSLEFSAISPIASVTHEHFAYHSIGNIEWIAILLFIGCMGKSAQFPLYLWLPDAMAGPTPVSALIHAATMVTAGVYVLGRCSALYASAPMASHIVTIVGIFTAFFAATVAIFQNDIKKVLAYSTVSQLGFMVLAMGVGAYAAGIFHLVTHAYFKGLLFLGAGSVIHGMHHEQDIRRMGGLKSRMVATTVTFMIGYLAIIGFPLMSGFFSKDHILHHVSLTGNAWYFIIVLLSALLTALYMTRLIALVFLGSNTRISLVKAQKIHESPNVMLIPLWILAFLSIVGGWKFFSFYPVLEKLFPTHAHGHALWHMTETSVAIISSVLVLLVAGFSMRYFLKAPVVIDKTPSSLEIAGQRQWYVDESLMQFGRYAMASLSKISNFIEKIIVDGLIGNIKFVVMSFARGLSAMVTGIPQSYVFFLLLGIVFIIYFSIGM
ncbi:MAG: NADH-quinone oxidoreductase subunit L [Bdellovibrionales bacterium]|nr:NADH-quinone oxidoreductase subunit L [Bdellovibrionales bacterium]